MSYVVPNADIFHEIAKGDLHGPINMLNLLRFLPKAAYEDGRDITGKEAYTTYSIEARPYFRQYGGEIIWRGVPFGPVIGPPNELWDAGFIAQYPSKDHFFNMIKDPGYQEAAVHRTAGLADSRLHAFAPDATGDAFG
ncbi:MAG: DUF1330 domain-containing protein [Pseudomonadota bacterium]